MRKNCAEQTVNKDNTGTQRQAEETEIESGAQKELGCGGKEWKGAEGDLECSRESELLSR